MDYLFSHKKLQNDEFIKQFSSRNHFKPLKPLKKRLYLSLKSEKHPKHQQNYFNSLDSEDFYSLFPLLPKWYDGEIFKLRPENYLKIKFLKNYKSLEISPSAEKRTDSFTYEKKNAQRTEISLPKIKHRKKFRESKETTQKYSDFRFDYEKKHEKQLIYIPSALYTNNCEDRYNASDPQSPDE